MTELPKEITELGMNIQTTNILTKPNVVRVGSKMDLTNYIFTLSNPNLIQGMTYDFTFNIDRLRSNSINTREVNEGDFVLQGTYKDTTRTITKGEFGYLKLKDNVSLVLRVVITDKVDIEFLEKSTFVLMIRGLKEDEKLSFIGSSYYKTLVDNKVNTVPNKLDLLGE